MKNYFLLLFAMLVATSASAQFYVSGSTGYATGSAKTKFGEEITATKTKNAYGSYGEGINFQVRGGYYFNETFGVDLGIAYLHGDDQTVTKVNIPNYRITDAKARARAFGFSPSLVYKFTNKIYGRFGALIKVGGKTEAVVSDKNYMYDEANGITISQALSLPEGSYTQTNYKADFHGKLPLGFVGALGYKYDFNDNFGLFIEAEYMGISVKRDDSELSEFNTDVMLPDGTVAVAGLYTMDNLPDGYVKKTKYVDTLDNATIASNGDAPYPAKKLAERVPYSSFGINFGLTYTFAKSKSKE
ncbi:outer membrane beta-barrel protein [Lutibacter sp. B1]|uniref:outer membrane beta-barrel protein n=1 Tax=Lutibacter sp. B1 TaxID=2725996 RepID=UPI0014578DCB|nr:outer membrane beta-barrel protein [Lutibacter sp. B1]NLP57636.1 porin family protein [Lutibacter sp. B1]